MSYCVHCGVELDRTASFCPLCHTPGGGSPPAGGYRLAQALSHPAGEVAPVSKVEVGLLITAMLASVAVCCGVLNLFLHAGRAWSLYVIGAAAMLWLWLVPPLLARGMHLLLRLAVGIGAVLLYVYLISVDLDGRTWFLGLGRAADPVGGRGAAGAGAGAAGLSPLPHHHSHHPHRQRGDLPAGGGAAGGSLAVPRLGARGGLWWCWWFAWAW